MNKKTVFQVVITVVITLVVLIAFSSLPNLYEEEETKPLPLAIYCSKEELRKLGVENSGTPERIDNLSNGLGYIIVYDEYTCNVSVIDNQCGVRCDKS